ncbi:MAG: hypothetical protein HZB13_15490 [Acidobacteria bacterium]|nr:hypothetical protein [Acidobacteriota bacterium]
MASPRPLLLVAATSVALLSCSTSKAPQPPKPGTPGFYWLAGQASFKKGDFAGAAKNLSNVARSEHENKAAARLLLTAIYSGQAQGDMEWVAALDAGLKVARTRQLEFRRLISAARSSAHQNAMQCGEQGHTFMGTVSADEVTLSCGIPDIARDTPSELEKIEKGALPQPTEVEQIHSQMLNRGVLLSLARLTGGGDVEKAKSAFAAGPVKLSRQQLQMYLAGEFVLAADLYTSKKLDMAGRLKVMCDEATEALASVPPSPERAKLEKKIAELMKPAPKT